MKKSIFTFVAICLAVVAMAQTVLYTPSNALIRNPEIGFYHFSSTGESANYNLLSAATLNGYRNNQNIVVIQRQFFLKNFVTGIPISQAYLNNVQADFNTIRSAGAKVIVRFTYTSQDATPYQPTKAQILNHIAQLAPVVNLNKDVISCIQAGFIGQYGEWYYTNSTEFGTGDYTALSNAQWANRKEVMEAMVNSFPSEIPLQLRYIYAKQKMYGNAYIGRIGFYNDAFLALDGDAGTFLADGNNPPSAADINYWVTNTTNLPVTGETNAVNAPRTDCDNTLLELNTYNWSLLNIYYYPQNIANWQTQGCFAEIQKNLGYRFELIDSNVTSNLLTIHLRNVGYANLFKDRIAYLVFKNTITGADYSFLLDNNLKNWTNQVYTIVTQLNGYAVPAGQYKLYLHLPDPNNNNVLYSIQMANVGTWVADQGYNDLQQQVTISNLGVHAFIENDQIKIDGISNYEIRIYDVTGKLISTSPDTSNLAKGLYFIKVNNTVLKIIK